jgi:hypothetical protein
MKETYITCSKCGEEITEPVSYELIIDKVTIEDIEEIELHDLCGDCLIKFKMAFFDFLERGRGGLGI